jgi:hypothetical protein
MNFRTRALILQVQLNAAAMARHAGISGRHVQGIEQGALSDLPRERVFPDHHRRPTRRFMFAFSSRKGTTRTLDRSLVLSTTLIRSRRATSLRR